MTAEPPPQCADGGVEVHKIPSTGQVVVAFYDADGNCYAYCPLAPKNALVLAGHLSLAVEHLREESSISVPYHVVN